MRAPRVVLGALEAASNRLLQADPDILPRLQTLESKVIELNITGLGIQVFALTTGSNVVFFDEFGGAADVRLSAPPLALVRMGLQQRQGKSTMGDSDISLQGDTRTAQQFQQLLAALELDWEELLSQRVGDIAARQVGLVAERVGRWLNRSHSSVDMAVRDYIQEEVQHSPAPIEVANFADDIDELRMGVDRIEARIQRLLNQ